MKNIDKVITEPLYDLIPSQQTMYLMVKFSFHKQLTQIPISFSVEDDLDFGLLKRAFNIEIERNDSLRLRFVMVDKNIKQYFEKHASLNYIQVKRFKNLEEQEAFFSKDAQKPVYFLKGENYRVYFFKTEGVGSGLYFNVSHLNLDAMGIVITLIDLLRVYKALRDGTEMPAPLDKYEDYIKAEFARLADTEKMKKHEDFYKRYFLKGGEPFHANVHGPELLEKERKRKKNPNIRVPAAYNPIYDKCEMIVKHIGAEDSKKIFDYCLEKKIAPESIFQLGMRTYCSAVNYRTPDVFIQSLCSKRATHKEKNMGGCLTQPLQLRTIISEDKTFDEALSEITSTRTQLFRHSSYPYGLALGLSREIYNYNLFQGPACMMFSWIPVPIGPAMPFKFNFRGYNLGRYFTPLYVITQPDPETMGITVQYMYRVKLANARDIENLHENAVRTILEGIENPNVKIGTLLDEVKK
ncbi:MAG: condensation domain-containing protein [Clostridia bacterium]|nr:condensation domain-containing protein [Clostridia bacterium]